MQSIRHEVVEEKNQIHTEKYIKERENVILWLK